MRTFVLRARKGTVVADKINTQLGRGSHFEIIAHTLMNAFYFSNGMREDVEVYVVLESSEDFPRTLKFFSNEGLSFAGFHEEAILEKVMSALAKSKVAKNECEKIEPGIEIYGFGFEKLMQHLIAEHRAIYLLDKKGSSIQAESLQDNSVFVLSDHLPMPKNNIKTLKRLGVHKLSLGKKMLFASQCVVLIHHYLD